MEKPEIQVLRFDSSVETLTSCEPYCPYYCGSENPGCQGVCVGDICPEDLND